MLSDTNGESRADGTSPDYPLAIQVNVVDTRTGLTIRTNQFTQQDMKFMKWDSPATCLAVPILRQPDTLEVGHRYKFILTVNQEATNLGPARAYIYWVVGDSM